MDSSVNEVLKDQIAQMHAFSQVRLGRILNASDRCFSCDELTLTFREHSRRHNTRPSSHRGRLLEEPVRPWVVGRYVCVPVGRFGERI